MRVGTGDFEYRFIFGGNEFSHHGHLETHQAAARSAREPSRPDTFMQFVEVNEFAFFGSEAHRSGIVLTLVGQICHYHRVFVHVVQTCSGVTRHPRSSVHLCAGYGHDAADDLSVDNRRGHERQRQYAKTMSSPHTNLLSTGRGYS